MGTAIASIKAAFFSVGFIVTNAITKSGATLMTYAGLKKSNSHGIPAKKPCATNSAKSIPMFKAMVTTCAIVKIACSIVVLEKEEEEEEGISNSLCFRI